MFVYFIKAFGGQAMLRIKIGSSKNPEARLRDLQVGSPVKLVLIGTVRCKSNDHAKRIERFAHNIFYKQRRRGEWFHLSEKHLRQMESLIKRAAERQVGDYDNGTSGLPSSSN